MTIVANIEFEDGWRRYEAKDLPIRVLDSAGDAVDLTGCTVRYVILRESGGTVLVEKTTSNDITIVAHADDTGDVKSVAKVHWAYDDYDDLAGKNYFAHELWDDSNHEQLIEGDAKLGEGTLAST